MNLQIYGMCTGTFTPLSGWSWQRKTFDADLRIAYLIINYDNITPRIFNLYRLIYNYYDLIEAIY
jgi:hypothetical protein